MGSVRESHWVKSVAGLFVGIIALSACGRLEQAAASSKAQSFSRAHLEEVRRLADYVETTCPAVVANVSPAKGSSVERDAAALEVTVMCPTAPIGPRNEPMGLAETNLRGMKTMSSSPSYYTIGVGKNESMRSFAEADLEEYARVPSSFVPNAVDLCVHRHATGLEVCVAYADR
jgi:hypothetical protein